MGVAARAGAMPSPFDQHRIDAGHADVMRNDRLQGWHESFGHPDEARQQGLRRLLPDLGLQEVGERWVLLGHGRALESHAHVIDRELRDAPARSESLGYRPTDF
jgi:hypothetical protein